jgi:hypothetical protein
MTSIAEIRNRASVTDGAFDQATMESEEKACAA